MFRFALAMIVIACCSLAPLPSRAQHASIAEAREIEIRGVKVKVPDLVLRDQDSLPVHFYSDLIKDKIVVLNFFYTSCTYSCPMQGKTLSEFQALLGERLGKSVFLISVTTDPVKDNPQQLKTWATRYKVKPGWRLVTGDEAELNKLLPQFIGNKAGGGMHEPVIFVGNDKKGVWTGAAGGVTPQELLRVVDYLAQ